MLRIGKILLAAGLIAWLIGTGRLDLSVLAVAQAPGYHAGGLALLLSSFVLQTVRWSWLLEDRGVHVPFVSVLKTAWVASFLGTFLPGALGGDVLRALQLGRAAEGQRLTIATTVAWDRAIGLYSLLWVALAASLATSVGALPGGGAAEAMAVTNIALLLGASAPLLFIPFLRNSRWPRVRRLLEFVPSARAFFSALAIGIVSNSLDTYSYVLAAAALGSTLTTAEVFLAGPLVTLANSLPLTPGGLGVGEAAAHALFGGLGDSSGAAIMLLTRIWSLIMRLGGGLWLAIG